MTDIAIPLYINGRELRGNDLSLPYERDGRQVNILLPELSAEHLTSLESGPKDLASLSTTEIIAFFSEVKNLWQNENYHLRKEAFDIMKAITHFHEKELAIDFSYIVPLLSEDIFINPTIQGELGGTEVLDGWIPRGNSLVRAMPRGRVLHVLAGNVPGSELLSYLRATLTRNSSILKMATGNPVTPSYLVRSFNEVDPGHPVTRAASVLYWPHGSPAEDRAYAMADAVCVWGGMDAVMSSWNRARPNMPVLDYGPKRSMAFIDRASVADPEQCADIAGLLAHDTAIHDQRACHCPQVVFVETPAKEFIKALKTALDSMAAELPKGYMPADLNAEISHVRMMSELQGDDVHHPGSMDWTVIATSDFNRTIENPLSRTLYIIEVDDLAQEAVSYADPFTMVVSFSSDETMKKLRDSLSLKGVDRFTRVGNMGLLPPGMPHEGRYDMTNMVRWVCCDNMF